MSRFITLPSLASARRDVPAGIVVFLVALPLCLGIALASGAPLPAGLISGVVAGLLVSLLSGSELSVSGPAAGLTVIVAGGIAQLGSFEALTVAVVLSGLFQLVFGALRAGVIGDYIPHSVIKGMLAAIGVVIILKQIPHALGQDRDFLGDEMFLQPDQMNTLTELWAAFSAPSPGAILISAVGLAVLILWERPVVRRRIGRLGVLPGPLLSVVAGTALNEAFGAWHPAWQLTAAKDHLVELPVPESFAVFLAMFRMPELSVLGRLDVWVIAITIALVGSIETLLCIEATDKLDAEKRISDTNRELVAQGVGNVVCGLLGGLPMTSVIVRSSANVYAGGRSRLSSFVHGVALLIAATMLAPLLNRVPLAALASILFVVGYKLASRRIIGEMWAKGWTQFLPFAVTLVAIVATDLLKGIAVGLLCSVFFVIRSNWHSAITLVNQNQNWLMRFNKDMSFVHKAELKQLLRGIPDRSLLIVDGTKSFYVDGDIYETMKEFETAASFRGIQLEYHNFFDKQLLRGGG